MQPITLQQIRELPRDRYNFILFSSNKEALNVYYQVVTDEDRGTIYEAEPNNIPLIRVGHHRDKDVYCPTDVHRIEGKTVENSILFYYHYARGVGAAFYKYQPITLKEL